MVQGPDTKNLGTEFPRELLHYETLLRATPHLLYGKTVLDFGCGKTDLTNELPKTTIVRVDKTPTDSSVIQSNGTDLIQRLGTQSIDITLALFVIHQIPSSIKGSVLRQLCAVTRQALHLGPIFGQDFKIIQRNLANWQVDLVVCQPFARKNIFHQFLPDPWMVKSKTDYAGFLAMSEEERIIYPKNERPPLVQFGGFTAMIHSGASHVILTKK